MTVRDQLRLVFGYAVALIMIVTMCAMAYGLYDERVNNADIFKFLNQNFSLILGAAIVYLTRDDGKKDG